MCTRLLKQTGLSRETWEADKSHTVADPLSIFELEVNHLSNGGLAAYALALFGLFLRHLE